MKFGFAWLTGAMALVSFSTSCATGNDQTCPPIEDDCDTGEGGDGGKPQPTYVGAKGVTVNKIVLYQGIERPIMENGALVPPAVAPAVNVPVVGGRDAVVRVFYSVDADYNGAPVTAVFGIDGQNPVALQATLGGGSIDDDMLSTLNFVVPGDAIKAPLAFVVRLDQEGKPADDNPAARFPADGTAVLPVAGDGNVLRITLVPFQYQADGSNRVPDTSPAILEKYRARFKQLYPVKDVQITVRAPFPYAGSISGGFAGFNEALDAVGQLRQTDNPTDDVYYYGIVNPAESFGQFCGGGCTAGIAPLNTGGSGSPEARFGLGLGYDGSAFETAVHELGHAHGREHADCGGASNIDPDYPHPDALIGVRGMDVATQELIPATRTDIMGYCDKTWVSDYTFAALFERSKAVNLPRKIGAAGARHAVVLIDELGRARIARTEPAWDSGGAAITARVTTAKGQREVDARFLGIDHTFGGWVHVPFEGEAPTRIAFNLDGRSFVAR